MLYQIISDRLSEADANFVKYNVWKSLLEAHPVRNTEKVQETIQYFIQTGQNLKADELKMLLEYNKFAYNHSEYANSRRAVS